MDLQEVNARVTHAQSRVKWKSVINKNERERRKVKWNDVRKACKWEQRNPAVLQDNLSELVSSQFDT